MHSTPRELQGPKKRNGACPRAKALLCPDILGTKYAFSWLQISAFRRLNVSRRLHDSSEAEQRVQKPSWGLPKFRGQRILAHPISGNYNTYTLQITMPLLETAPHLGTPRMCACVCVCVCVRARVCVCLTEARPPAGQVQGPTPSVKASMLPAGLGS